MPRLSVEDRISEAYVEMAMQANYRPESSGAASGDDDLQDEAESYAKRFVAEEETTNFHIGVSDYTSNRALVYTIEAARLLCCGALGVNHGLKLLEMAVAEVKAQLPNYPELPKELRGARFY
jgi:hypothetical protein